MNFLGLFEGYGIELEYMIVDRDSLTIKPISDLLLKAAAGTLTSDFEDGEISWTNELVLHVIELKTTNPAASLHGLEKSFHRSLNRINGILEKHGACLLPTAMHPLMSPEETRLWPHDNNEIYEAYNRIFSCKGHGWSNLQSMHINLPFKNDDEFKRLHTAIRFVLPLLPALTASSPVVEGKLTSAHDNRLLFYQQNQKRVPSIAGQVVPEFVSSKAEYREKILGQIYSDIAPFDPEEILRDDWLNSRGAIARFERQSIEIRVLDLQESPNMDIAIADFICATIRSLVAEDFVSAEAQSKFSTESLKEIFDSTAKSAEQSAVKNQAYLEAWMAPNEMNAGELWKWIFSQSGVKKHLSLDHRASIEFLLAHGTLSTRILKAIGHRPEAGNIRRVYSQLSENLRTGAFFEP